MVNLRQFIGKGAALSLLVVLGVSAVSLAPPGFTETRKAPEMSEKAAVTLAKFERTGEHISCINVRRINEIKALDDHHFLVRVGLRQYYLNITSNRCTGASRMSNRLQYTTSGAQLCRNEIITVIDNSTGILSGSCGLGDFERLEKKPDQPDG